MTELPQATSRRELREREAAAAARTARPAPLSASLPTAPRPRTALPPRPTSAPHPARPTRRHGVASKLLSFAALLFAGALAVGMSVPANAFSAASGSIAAAGAAESGAAEAGSAVAGDPQTATVAADQAVSTDARDGFQVLSWAQVLAQQYAHVNSYKFSGGSGSVRWPFPYQVPISSPYGPRVAPCAGCSTFHNGVDFTPGEGAAIFAIADGVVTAREDGHSEYGNYVVITHKIGGATVTSTYAHMLAGSSAIQLGQTVEVGDFLGLVGMTGEATGPHLHFEISVNGTKVDPIPWLEAHVD